MAGAVEHDAGYGIEEEEVHQHVDIDDVERQLPKAVTAPTTEVAPTGDVSSELAPEGDNNNEETQVAKKPRTEKKAANGVETEADEAHEKGAVPAVVAGGIDNPINLTEKADDDEDSVEEGNEEEQEFEMNGKDSNEDDDEVTAAAGAEDDEDDEEATPVVEKSNKDGPEGVGLRTLLQEGDTKSSAPLLNHADLGDATHMLNGAK